MRYLLLCALLLPIPVIAAGCDDDDPPNNTSGEGGAGQGGAGQGGGVNPTGGNLTLDTAYGNQGIASISRSWSTDWIFAAAWMSDGSVLWGGSTAGPYDFHTDMLLVRVTADAKLDTGFGNGGFVVRPSGDGAVITSLEPLADGGALVAGTFYRFISAYAFISRVDAKGALDPSFGVEGTTTVPIDPSERYAKIARTATGQIILFAMSNKGPVWLWRLSADGAMDASFGDAGHAVVGGEAVRDVVVQPDGSILALVSTGSTSGELHRFAASGSPDSSFGGSGKVDVTFDPYDVDLHNSGALIVAGGDNFGSLLKLDGSGTPDPAFGTDGVLNPPMVDSQFTAVKWLPNGDILTISSLNASVPILTYRTIKRLAPDGTVLPWNGNDVFNSPLSKALGNGNIAGILEKNGTIYIPYSKNNPSNIEGSDGMMLAVNDDGTINQTFGTAGIAQFGSLAGPEVLWDMARQSDGSTIPMGVAGTDGIFAKIKNQALDPAFGDQGFANTPYAGNGVTVDPSDRILLASAGNRIERYTATGQPDMTFGTMGIAPVLKTTGTLADVEVDAKQRIVVAGEATSQGAIIARLLDDGSLDSSFGSGGIVMQPADSGMSSAASALTVEPDGTIAFVGFLGNDTFFARVLEDGTTDTSFGTSGKTVVKEKIRAFRIIPRKGGGYLSAGSDWWCATDPACPIIIVGLKADGTLDEAFGTGGLARVEEASYFQAWHGLVELPDGGIAVAGAVLKGFNEQLAVWRLLSNGSLDPDAPTFILPGKGRATSAVVDGDGLLVGGWAFSPATGTDMVTLRFKL